MPPPARADRLTPRVLEGFVRAHRVPDRAIGLNFPVVPKGDEEIRFQISADHTVIVST
jgi:hypothetical protein